MMRGFNRYFRPTVQMIVMHRSEFSSSTSVTDQLSTRIDSVRYYIQQQSNYILGAEELQRIKSTIGGLQESIIKEKEELWRETENKNKFIFRLSECESNIDHLRRFRKHADGHNLDPNEYITTLNALNADQHQMQQFMEASTKKVEELANNIQKLQVILDTQLALRYQEELLVLERSRTFSAIATLASFITTCLLIVTRSIQTNAYEKSIEEARVAAESARKQSELELQKSALRDVMLGSLLGELRDMKALITSQKDVMERIINDGTIIQWNSTDLNSQQQQQQHQQQHQGNVPIVDIDQAPISPHVSSQNTKLDKSIVWLAGKMGIVITNNDNINTWTGYAFFGGSALLTIITTVSTR